MEREKDLAKWALGPIALTVLETSLYRGALKAHRDESRERVDQKGRKLMEEWKKVDEQGWKQTNDGRVLDRGYEEHMTTAGPDEAKGTCADEAKETCADEADHLVSSVTYARDILYHAATSSETGEAKGTCAGEADHLVSRLTDARDILYHVATSSATGEE